MWGVAGLNMNPPVQYSPRGTIVGKSDPSCKLAFLADFDKNVFYSVSLILMGSRPKCQNVFIFLFVKRSMQFRTEKHWRRITSLTWTYYTIKRLLATLCCCSKHICFYCTGSHAVVLVSDLVLEY